MRRIGLARAYKYIWYRVNRLPAGPHSIASGLATGCAMSFTPLIGVHFFVAAGLAWIIRGNVVASAFGTIVGNPWTFPVIWILTYELGSIILGLGSFSTPSEASFVDMYTGLVRSAITLDMELFSKNVWPILFPMLIGSIPISFFIWVTVYKIFYSWIDGYQARRFVALKRIGLEKEKNTNQQHKLSL